MSPTNQVFLLTFLIVATGFLIKSLNFITEKEGRVISKFLMHSTFPVLMIVSTARLKFETSLFFLPLAYMAFAIVLLSLAWLVFLKYPQKLRGLFLMAVGGANTGLFGFPIVEGLFGKQALTYAIMIDIGNTLLTFGVSYPLGKYLSKNGAESFDFKAIIKKVFSLPPFLGMLFGLFINFSGLQMPEIFYKYLDVLARGNMPIGLLLLGIYLSFDLSKNEIVGIVKLLILRYGFMLVMATVLINVFPNTIFRNTVLLCCFLPLGLTILPFSDEMNYDSKVAGTLVNLSLLLSFVLMWVLMNFWI
jgi:malate permease and related proteins